MLLTAIRNLWAHKLRFAASALSIMLGVALTAGTLTLTATMRQTYDNLFASVYQGTDAVVRAKAAFEGPQESTGAQRARIPATLLPTIAAIPGVAAADGNITGYARIIGADGKALGNPQAGPPSFAMNWSANPKLNQFHLVDGRAPQAPGEVVIDRKSATDGHLAVSDHTTVLMQAGPQRVRIVGVARFGTADSPGGATIVAFRAQDVQALVGGAGKFDSISVVAASGLTQSDIVNRIAPHLPAGTEVVTGAKITAETQNALHKAFSFFNTFLYIFAIVAILVGAFMVFNTFSITVAQRTRENGLLRALGASRRQVLAAVLVEAAVIGLVASALGVVAGLGVAVGLKALMAAVGIDIPTEGLVVTGSTIAISLFVGVVITALAALSPARKAGKVAPIAAMQSGVVGSTGYGSRQRIYVGAAVLLAGVSALLLGLFGHVSSPLLVVGAGAILVFFGVSILGRTIALPLSRVIGWPLPRLRGLTGTLARENAMRNPKRTAASASALMIGVGLVGFITIFVTSTTASINTAIDHSFVGDVVVDSGGGMMGGVDPSLARRVATLPQVAGATGLRAGVAQVDGKAVLVQAADPASMAGTIKLDVVRGTLSGLDATGIAVWKPIADEEGWKIGQAVPAVFAETGHRTLHLAAVYGENTVGNYFLGTKAYDANFAARLDMRVFVKAAPGVSVADVRRAVETVTKEYPGVSVLDRAEYKANSVAPFNQLLSMIYVLLGLAVVIALLGIANTLALSIAERTREVGLLRAVGMTRGQLRSTIRWEAVIIALQGTVLGLLIGTFFGWALTRAMRDQGITTFAYPWASLAVVVVIAAVAGALAAVQPSRHAAKLDVLRAVVTE